MGKVQIGAAIGASFRFVGEGWRRAWGILLILVWFTAALQIIELLRPTWTVVSLLGFVASVFVTTAATGALYRLRLSADHPGDDAFAAHPGGLQWGGLEWRVLAANLLVGVAVGALVFVAFIVWALILGLTVGSNPAEVQALQSGSDADKLDALRQIMLGPAGIFTFVIIGPIAVGLIYLGLRLSVFALFAADTRSFDAAKAWTVTRGAVLALLVGSIAIFLLELVIGAVFGGVAGFFAGFTGQVGQGRIWGGVAGQIVGAALNAPLIAGLVLYVYRSQRGDPGVAAAFS
jgi:hypothetical protein